MNMYYAVIPSSEEDSMFSDDFTITTTAAYPKESRESRLWLFLASAVVIGFFTGIIFARWLYR